MMIYIGILLGMLGISIMQLVLATAMPFIVTEIGGDALYGWVFSSYMLASLLTIPVFSKLADLYGKKQFYLLGMGLFAAGTLYGGFAPTMPHLIVARVIQGLGAGMMGPVSLALISELFPPEKRGHMIGAFSFVQLFANLLSPLLGSWVTKQLGWHWIFYITLALVLVAISLVAADRRVFPPATKVAWSRIDLLGGLLFGAFCVLVVNVSDALSGQDALGTTGVLMLIGALVSGLLLVWNESRHADPLIKVAFFKTKVLRRSILSSLIAGAIMYGLVTLLPLCSLSLQQAGLTLDESRALMIFLVGTTFGLLLASRLLTKLTSAFPKLLWGLSLAGAGLLYYAVSAGQSVLFLGSTGFLGLCLGGITATLLINSQNAVSNADRTVLSGIVQLGRYLGAALGVTVLTGILPTISQAVIPRQFLGAFAILLGIYVLGLVNELV
jgi:MFS family permease